MELGLREGIDFDFFRAQKEAHLAGLPSDVADKGFWSYVRFSFSRWYGDEKVESPLFQKRSMVVYPLIVLSIVW